MGLTVQPKILVQINSFNPSSKTVSFGYTLGFDNGKSTGEGKKYSLKIGFFDRQGNQVHTTTKYLYPLQEHPHNAADYVKRMGEVLKQTIRESSEILNQKITDPLDRQSLDKIVGIVPSITKEGKTAVIFPYIYDAKGEFLKNIPLYNLKNDLGAADALFVHDAQAVGFNALRWLADNGILKNHSKSIGVHYPGGGYARFDADIIGENILAKSMEDQHVPFKFGKSIEKGAVSEGALQENFVRVYNALSEPSGYKLTFEELQKRGLGAKFLSEQLVHGTDKAKQAALSAIDEMIQGIVRIAGNSVLKATDTIVVFGKIIGGFKKAFEEASLGEGLEKRMDKALDVFLETTGPGPMQRLLNKTKLFVADIHPDSLESIPLLEKAKAVPGKSAWLTVPLSVFEKLPRI